LYKSELTLIVNPAAKEVSRYAAALQKGFALVRQSGLLSINHILEIHKELEQNDAGIRKVPGTELINEQTGAVVYTPPQDHREILRL
jgi:hypothetical protein